MIYLFDGITPDSHIVHCRLYNDKLLEKIQRDKYIIIKKFCISMTSSSSDAYVVLQEGMVSLQH